MKLLLIQGANMEYLGRRQPELYGTTSARELDAILRRRARELDVDLDILYTNTEGEAVSAIYRADRANVDGILFNPAGFLHAGHALRDCLRSINAPVAVPGIDFSDHLNYWKEGFPALMVTDTAFMRNPHYHQAGDTYETLDYLRMAKVVQGVHAITQAAN